jgi:hypothetical protein
MKKPGERIGIYFTDSIYTDIYTDNKPLKKSLPGKVPVKAIKKHMAFRIRMIAGKLNVTKYIRLALDND